MGQKTQGQLDRICRLLVPRSMSLLPVQGNSTLPHQIVKSVGKSLFSTYAYRL